MVFRLPDDAQNLQEASNTKCSIFMFSLSRFGEHCKHFQDTTCLHFQGLSVCRMGGFLHIYMCVCVCVCLCLERTMEGGLAASASSGPIGTVDNDSCVKGNK
jgi:hypothetical protein